MINSNSTNESLVPNIIFDTIGIVLCFIVICETFIFIFLIVIRHQFIKSKDKILFLLSLNMYMSIFIFTLFILDIFISMLKGHIYSNILKVNNGTRWCYFKIYLTHIAVICSFYSNTFQALYRYFRIIYYTRPFFYQNISLYIIGILIQIILSALQTLPLLLTNEYNYEDYHCQINLKNWHGMLIGSFLTWLLPISITIIIYIRTIRYIHNNSPTFTHQQHTRIKRDATIIKRILWLTISVLLFGIPACSLTIIYYLFGYYEWWENHFVLWAFVFSFFAMNIIQTYYSPHLRILWITRIPNQINPQQQKILRNLK